MTDLFNSYDRAVHSDFLVHWTGRDIDGDYDPAWRNNSHRSFTSSQAADRYLQRLHDILKFGLWMTEETARTYLVGTRTIAIPPTPQCCFTELRPSDSRRHAALYGRLGIGVKRPFLFERYGRPLAYFGYGEKSHNDKFLEACLGGLEEKRLLNFFKPMNSSSGRLTYELYAESEWRILWFDELLKQKKIIDPRDSANAAAHEYFNSLHSQQQERLKFLIPLDGWFAMIIYPSLQVKNRAQREDGMGIVQEIERIKLLPDHGNRVEGLPNPRRGNWPIEVDLDACANF